MARGGRAEILGAYPSRSQNDDTPEAVAERVAKKAQGLAEVLLPTDSDEPILGSGVRHAVSEWMIELRAADELDAVGVKPRNTALLFGPPGCGKTTLAHHFAARLGLPLMVIRGENIVGSHLGESGQNIGRVFDILREERGKIVGFFDEFDAVATSRTSDNQACGRELNAVVTAMLTNIESFRGIFFAATNRSDSLDSAIWRRFGMQIEVQLPDFDERFAIMKRYGLPFDFSDDLLDLLTRATRHATPALLRQMMEGLKRTFILAPRLRREINDPIKVFAAVLAQVKPHPDATIPALWEDPSKSLMGIAATEWPPSRMVQS